MIFLLKKNIWADIIKMILGYLSIAALEMLKEQKVVITSVGQGYKSTEDQYDYKIRTEIIYRGREMSINNGKAKDNYNKNSVIR